MAKRGPDLNSELDDDPEASDLDLGDESEEQNEEVLGGDLLDDSLSDEDENKEGDEDDDLEDDVEEEKPVSKKGKKGKKSDDDEESDDDIDLLSTPLENLPKSQRAIASALRRQQSGFDRVLGSIQESIRGLTGGDGNKGKPAEATEEETEEEVEHPFAKQWENLNEESRNIIHASEAMAEYALKKAGLGNVRETLTKLEKTVSALADNFVGQQRQSEQEEIDTLLTHYKPAEVTKYKDIIKGMRGMINPETRKRYTYLEAFETVTKQSRSSASKQEVADDLEDVEEDVIASAKRRARGRRGSSRGGRGRAYSDDELDDLFSA